MARNIKDAGTGLLGPLLEGLRSRLPAGWRVNRGRGARTLTLAAPSGATAVLRLRVRDRVGPRDVDRVIADGDGNAGTILVGSRYLSPQTRERLAAAGASYADLTGNWRIVLADPGLFIQTEGAARDPDPPERRLRSLKGPTAGRAIRALCDFRPPYGIRELAERARIPLGSLSRVVSLLDEEALIERRARGPVESVDWSGLIRRWAQDYAVLDSNESSTWLAPRGLSAVLQRLASRRRGVAVTGPFAANTLAPVAPARLMMIYTSDPTRLAEKIGLTPADAGANVILLVPFDDVALERTWRTDGPPLASHSQIAGDLLTSPGRGPQEGEELLKWMGKHEDAWRS